eukprot:5225053-Prymnesium_polylepis.2
MCVHSPSWGVPFKAARHVVARHNLARAALLANGARGGGHAARAARRAFGLAALEAAAGDGDPLLFLLVRHRNVELGGGDSLKDSAPVKRFDGCHGGTWIFVREFMLQLCSVLLHSSCYFVRYG